MTLAIRVTARAVLGAIGAGAVVGATAIAAAPSAFADPPPNCTAADLAQVTTGCRRPPPCTCSTTRRQRVPHRPRGIAARHRPFSDRRLHGGQPAVRIELWESVSRWST